MIIEDVTVAWGQKPHPLDSQFGNFRLQIFQDVQESLDTSKLYFLSDDGPKIAIFDLNLRCFVGEMLIDLPGKMKFLFSLKCPSPQGGTALILVTEEDVYGEVHLNVHRLDISADGFSISDRRSLVSPPIQCGGEYICSMREDAPEIVVMANPGLQIWRLNCMMNFPQDPPTPLVIGGADLDHFYDGFANSGMVVFLSATPDGHFDSSRVHLLDLNAPGQICTQQCFPDPTRGMPVPRKQCGFDSFVGGILMAGGEIDFQQQRLEDLWVLDTKTFQWTQIPSKVPCALIEPRITACNSGNVFLWGDFDQPLPGMPPSGTHLRIMRASNLECSHEPVCQRAPAESGKKKKKCVIQ